MNKENQNKANRSEIIHDALGMLDDDMIEEVDRLRGHIAEDVSSVKKVHTMKWRKWTALAASVCLLVIGSWAWERYIESAENMTEDEMQAGNQAPEAESEAEKDMESVIGTEGIPLDSNCGIEDGVETEVEDPSNMGVGEEPEDSANVEAEEFLGVLGDEFHLLDNYVKVWMLPAKAWIDNNSENFAGETEYLSQAVVIKEDYREDMDKLVTNMCTASYVKRDEVKEESDMDMVYHLFFERTDGKIIHCWLLEDGYLYYDDLDDICLKLDGEVYATVYKILAMHW